MVKISVLMVEDSLYAVDLNLRELKKTYEEVDYLTIANCRALQRALSERHWDLILSEFRLPCYQAFQGLQAIKASKERVPFVIVSEPLSQDDKAKALQMGCSGFVTKDNLTMLRRFIPKLVGSLQER